MGEYAAGAFPPGSLAADPRFASYIEEGLAILRRQDAERQAARAAAEPEPEPEPEPDPVQPTRAFSRRDDGAFLALVREGYGRYSACEYLGVSYRSFLKRLRADDGLAERLAGAERHRADECLARIHDLAMQKYDKKVALRAAERYIDLVGKRAEKEAAARAEAARQAPPPEPEAEAEAPQAEVEVAPAPKRPKDPMARRVQTRRRHGSGRPTGKT